jgi:HD-GYP domain-containing protein (c-di-GMP phosphodiesterase class II)
VIETGEPYVSREYRSDPRTRATSRPLVPIGGGGVTVPIRAGQEIIGVLYVGVILPREIQPNEVHLLTTIAEIAGNAIHRMRLNEQTQTRLERLQALRAVDSAISGTFDLRMVLNVLLEKVTLLMGVDAASVLLLNERTRMLEFRAGMGFRTRGIERSQLQLGEDLAGKVALEQRVFTTADLPGIGAAFVRQPLLVGEDFVFYCGVPLITKGKVKGVLDIFHRSAFSPDPEWLDFLETIAGQTAIAVDAAELFEGLERSNTELGLAYETTLEGWSRALDLRDEETEGHTRRVTDLTILLAGAMGMSDGEIAQARRGALLHDIGKMGIPDSILLKPGSLTEAEWQVMRRHPTFARDLLSPIAYLRDALDIPYCHHEKWDGTGYPRGLRGEAIPLAARIFALADVYDALTSDRPYRQAWPKARALEHLRAQAGAHFDPRVAEAFLRLAGERNE